MAGITWYKRGSHNSRQPRSEVIESDKLVLALQDAGGAEQDVVEDVCCLQEAIGWAKLARHDEENRVTENDIRRQLRAMLKLDDEALRLALSRCDQETFRRFNRGWNEEQDLNFSQIDWVPAEHNKEVPGPQSMRRGLRRAVDAAYIEEGQKGRKFCDYQIDLACVCIQVRPRYKRLKLAVLAKIVFEEAGIVVGAKRLEQVLTQAKKVNLTRVKR